MTDPTDNLPAETAAALGNAMAEDKAEKVGQATALVRLAEARYRFAQADDGRTFAVQLNGPNLALPLRGRESLRGEMAAAYFDAHGRAPSSSALADALNVIEGRAAAAGRESLALRVATHNDGIAIDLGTADGRAVVVTPSGWSVEPSSPVLFRRTELTAALPEPTRGGSLDALRKHVNVTDDAWGLLVGVLVCWLLPDVPRPVVLLIGEQGTGKTTAARLLAALIDPSPAQVRGAPRDLGEWALAASGSWVVVLDNLSSISEWLSDAICRACTGEGMVRRALYTDDGLSVTSYRRNVMLTTIDAGALRGDLGDRLVTVDLDVIDPKDRCRDKVIAESYREDHPQILGALLDLTAQALAERPRVHLTDAPRMADFAHVLAALDHATGWHTLDTYRALGASIASQVIESDPVAHAVAALARREGAWTGTATELHQAITPERPPKDWPKTARGTSGHLRRAAPALRAVGVGVGFPKRDAHARLIELTSSEGGRTEPSSSSPPSSTAPDQHRADDGPDDDRAGDLPTVTTTVIANRQLDQHEHTDRDGRDGRDGLRRTPSSPSWRRVEGNGPRPPCTVHGCHRFDTMIDADGRAVCGPHRRAVAS